MRILTIILSLLLFSCKKQESKNIPDHLQRAWGAITDVSARKGGVKGKPVKDTVVTLPDTIVTPPPPVVFPSSFKIQMPPVINQGSDGSCVSMAVGYYSLSAEIFYNSGAGTYDYSTNIFSPEFLFNNVKTSTQCSSGTTIPGNFNFLINTGCILWKDAPYSWTNGCEPFQSAAPKTKIKGYQQIASNNDTTIKSMLLLHHPFAFTFTADYSFYYGRDYDPANLVYMNGEPGYVWHSYSPELYGPHACTVVGWDDSKQAWLIVNSFGSAWGDNGYRWIDYKFFSYITQSAFTINI